MPIWAACSSTYFRSANLCRLTAAHYSYVDLDLLLTGAVLHDIGKVAELTYERSFGYSAEGQLLGHIVIGLRLLHEKLQRFPDFPPKLRVLVEHMIVSHHGELEFGSPKVPLFPEALLLHHLDNLDSKMECMRAMVAKDRHVEGCWTGYNASLERSGLEKGQVSGGAAGRRQRGPEAAESAPPIAASPPPADGGAATPARLHFDFRRETAAGLEQGFVTLPTTPIPDVSSRAGIPLETSPRSVCRWRCSAGSDGRN